MAGKLLVREIPVSAVYCRGRPIGRIVLNGVTLWEGLRRLPLLQLTDCGSGTTATAIALSGGFAGAVRHSRSDTAAAAGTTGHTASVQDVGRSRADVKLTPTIDAALLLIPAGTAHEVTARLEEGVAALIRAAGDYEAGLGQSDRAAAAAGSGHDGISATTGSEDGMGAVTNGTSRPAGTAGQSGRSACGASRAAALDRAGVLAALLSGRPAAGTDGHGRGSARIWDSGGALTAIAGGWCAEKAQTSTANGASLSKRAGFGLAAALGVRPVSDVPWAAQDGSTLTVYRAWQGTQTERILEVM